MSVPDSLATRQALHADASPAPIVDQPLQRFAEGVEELLIDPFDELAGAAQLHRVEVEATLIQHGEAPLELHRRHREANGRRRRDDVLGQRIDPGEVPCAGICQQVGDAPEAVGRGQ